METPSLASTSEGETPTRREQDAAPKTGASYISLWNRLRAGLALQEAYSHPEVIKQLPRFNKEQTYFDTVTARAKPFLYNIVVEAERRQLPMELALLPFIESAFNPNAYSRQRAVGLWQFMSGTARGYGLRQDWWAG
jgi:membrane-bound lytic murein transglycosylase D